MVATGFLEAGVCNAMCSGPRTGRYVSVTYDDAIVDLSANVFVFGNIAPLLCNKLC